MHDESKKHLRRASCFFMGLLIAVLTLGILTASSFLFVLLLLVIVPALLIGWGLGAFLYTRDGVRLAIEPGQPWMRAVCAAYAPILAIAALVLSPIVLRAGRDVATTTHFLLARADYRRIIAEAKRGMHRDGGYQEAHGRTFIVDEGPTIRVAFDPEGFLDNWSGIIFDPTGAVMQADGFDPVTGRFAAPDHVTKLFGGDLVACRRLHGDYYTCSFT